MTRILDPAPTAGCKPKPTRRVCSSTRGTTKLVIIDGRLAFTGGMDSCDCRWDGREMPEALREQLAMGVAQVNG